MTWQRVGRELAIFAAVFTGLAVYVALEVVYLATLGGFFFLTGFPTPSGAPLEIHPINTAIKGGWAAFGYGLVMRLVFGRVNLAKVAGLWLFGLGFIGILGTLVIYAVIPIHVIGNVALLAYLLTGQFLARDWVTK